MIRYRQHRPAFFEGFTNEDGEAATLEGLLALEFIHNFATSPHFSRFSLGTEVSSPNHGGKLVTLMAEYREGKEWWVVAYLWPEGEELAALPKWEPVYE